MLKYKGYVGHIEFDSDAEIFHGEVLGIRDVITFQGKSVDEIKKALIDSIEDYFDMCAKHCKQPEKPFSGKLLLRLDHELHRQIVCAALKEKKSINSWIVGNLQKASFSYT